MGWYLCSCFVIRTRIIRLTTHGRTDTRSFGASWRVTHPKPPIFDFRTRLKGGIPLDLERLVYLGYTYIQG